MKLNLKVFFPVAVAMMFILSITGYAHGKDSEPKEVSAIISFAHPHELSPLSSATALSAGEYIEAYVNAIAAVEEEAECPDPAKPFFCVNCTHTVAGTTSACHVYCPASGPFVFHRHVDRCGVSTSCPCFEPYGDAPGCTSWPRVE